MGSEIREWVEGQRASLAKRAYRFVEGDEKIREALKKLDPNPLRVLLGAAASASCLDEVRVLLRYQHGRDKDKWPIDLVEAIDGQLRDAVDEAKKKADKPGDFDAVEAMIATIFLGFVVQLHRYHHKTHGAADSATGDAKPAQAGSATGATKPAPRAPQQAAQNQRRR